MTRAESARINGTLSHGPVTAEGKARSSRNAVTHGLNSSEVVIAGESQDEFDELLAAYVLQHRPADDIERSLVFEMAAARWRMRRLVRVEAATFDEEVRKVLHDDEHPVEDPDRAMSVAMHRLASGKALANVHRYESRLRRQYANAMNELLERQESRRSDPVQNEPKLAPDRGDGTQLRQVRDRLVGQTNPTAKARAFIDVCIAEIRKCGNEPARPASAVAS
jgi:hypothetical protein